MINSANLNSLKSNIEKYVIISQEDFNGFADFFKPELYKAKDIVLFQGEACREQRFVTKGVLKAYHTDALGKEYVQLFAFEGWWMSDLASFVTGNPASLTIQAIEDSEVLSITYEDFQLMLSRYPLLEKHFRILFQNAFVAQQQKVMHLISDSIEERYEYFMKAYSSHINRISQKDIASFIGSTPEHLSYLRKKRSTRR